MTLTVRLKRDAVPEEQCMTAELSAITPEVYIPYVRLGSITSVVSGDNSWQRNNRVKICLGEPPNQRRLFTSGELKVFSTYPCVGSDTYPCGTGDTVENAVEGTTQLRGSQQIFRSTQDDVSVFVQVADPLGRIIDSTRHSLTRDGVSSWHTARDRLGDHLVPGVKIGYQRLAFNDEVSDWTNVIHTVGVSGLDGGNAPGRMKIRFVSSGNPYYEPNPTHTRAPWPLTRPLTVVVWYFAEFSTLGTYVVDFTAAALHNGGTTTTDDDVTYTGKSRSIFHVGPVSDLEAGGQWDAVDDGQVVFTVSALNHGPDHAPDARLSLDLPEGVTVVQAVPSQGTYRNGVWRIGELKHKEHRRALEQPEAATLQVFATVAGSVTKPIRGGLANHQDYCVRIKTGGTPGDDLSCDSGAVPGGYTQHSTEYYDYNPDNNEIELDPNNAAAAGTIPRHVIGAGVASTPGAGDAYVLGETIDLEITFSEDVRVQGTPTLALEIGEVTRQVPMSAYSGAKLTFSYIVAAGDTDTDGVSVPRDGLTLPDGASITNLSGRTDAVLQFLGFGNQAGHKVSTPAAPEPAPPFYVDVPGAPSGLTATPGDGQVTLEWGLYCCDQKALYYQFWRGDFPTWQDIAGSGRDTSEHTVSGLTNGDTYHFRVRAVYRDDAGDEHPGRPSRMVAATPHAPTTTKNNPPVFAPDDKSYSVVERAPRGTEVARVRATDSDGDRLTYTLSGEHADRFSIANVGGEGVIRVAEMELGLTWEPGGVSFTLGVEVSDTRGGRDSRFVGVEVTASADRQAVLKDADPGTLSVACNTAAGKAVATINAASGAGDSLWYILVDGADKFQFAGGGMGPADSIWSDDHAVLVTGTGGAALQVKNLAGVCGTTIIVIVEVEEQGNPGNNATLSFEVRVGDPPSQ